MSMTPEARRWAVLLMLIGFRENEQRDRYDKWHPDEPKQEAESHRALKAALAQFRTQPADLRHVLHVYVTGGWRTAPSFVVARVNEALDWLAARMPAEIVIPNGGDWQRHWSIDRERYNETYGHLATDPLAPLPPAAVIAELLELWHDVDREHRTSSGADWSMPAVHRGESRASGDLATVYGENAGTVGVRVKRSSAPPGRPRHGSKDAQRVEQLLLEQCPGRTIDELRAALAPGRPSDAALEIRPQLTAAIKALRDQQRATPEALAEALCCDVRTIHRLAAS